jgi:hypothetical protein
MKKKHSFGDFDAFTLFPEVMQRLTDEGHPEPGNRVVDAKIRGSTRKPQGGRLSNAIPPHPPDVSWLGRGIFEDKEKIGDVAAALLLMRHSGSLREVSRTLENSGYQIECSESANEALSKLTATTYAVVVLHTDFEGGMPLEESKIHACLAKMPMARRRRIHYILIGPEFRTLYNLEALSLSANLVVNDADIGQLPGIFKKSFRDYINLFGPLLESLDAHR